MASQKKITKKELAQKRSHCLGILVTYHIVQIQFQCWGWDVIMSWCQGCSSCKHAKSTSGCLGTGLLTPSPGWAGKISLPLVHKSLAWRWLPNLTRLCCGCSHRAVGVPRMVGNLRLILVGHPRSQVLEQAITTPYQQALLTFFFPGNTLQPCSSLSHKGFDKQFLNQDNWLPLLYPSLLRPSHSQSPTHR